MVAMVYNSVNTLETQNYSVSFFWGGATLGSEVPRPGFKPVPPAVEAWRLSELPESPKLHTLNKQCDDT